MSKFHITITQWGLVSSVRQSQSDMIVVCAPRSPFSVEARKGQLVVVVEAEGDVSRGRQACELVAKTISETFYADGSTSITSSLRQSIKAANNALYQYNFSAPPHKRAMVGATCAVVHGSDLYLTQVPPAQAFLSHTTKLRALPLPLAWTNGANPAAAQRQGAIGTSLGSEPEFSRAVLQPGDIVVLCASNIVRLLGRHQAEQLICYSDGPTIAEELYKLCRSANLPESHAIVLEAVAGEAPGERETILGPAVVADKSKHVVGRFGSLFNRGARQRTSVPHATPQVQDGVEVAAQSVAVASVAASPTTGVAAATRPLTVMDTLPVADETPLPASAFIGEGEYGGQIRPPAVPKRNRQIDLGDNHGTPVDFAAIPRKNPPPPPTFGDRLTFPLRSAFVSLLSGAANVPRRTVRPAERLPAQGLKLRDLSYRRQRPRLPWINILLILGVIAALVYLGLQKNLERDNTTVDVALNKVQAAVQAARTTNDPNQAQLELTRAEVALNQDVSKLVQEGLITTTKTMAWSRYLDVRNTYDQAMASINRIGFIGDLETVATLPGEQGIIKRLVLGTTATISDTEPPIYFLDGTAGVLYQNGQNAPILRPDQEAGIFVAKNVREALWREEGKSVIALDRGDPSFPVYHVYLRNGDGWLSNQLNQTEHMKPNDDDLPMTTFGGHLYIWDEETDQLWKYASGMYADLPTAWITNAGGASLEQVVDVQIEGDVYLLNRDASVSVFNGGALVRQLPAPQLKVPVDNVSRFVVTPDVYEEDGITLKQPGFIYILDLRNERVLQLSKKDGALIQQIQARSRGPLNQITDLAVDQARGTLYLANGSRVLSASLPEPPQLEADITTTTTPTP